MGPSRQLPIKILHVIIGLGAGGAERMLARLVLAHRTDTRYQHAIISLTTLGPVGHSLRTEGVEIDALAMQSLFDLPRIVWQLVGAIRSRRPAIVQTWMYHADLLGGVAARIAGNARVVWGVRATDMMTGTARATWTIRRLCALLSRSVPDVIVCVAEAARRAHVAIGYEPSRMVIIPNGFDLQNPEATLPRGKSLREDLGWSEEMRVVGWVGRFNHYKDPENFVRAAGLLARTDRQVRFLAVGRDMVWENVELAAWISEAGCTDRFALLGDRSDVTVCLSAMDVFCLSSRSEGFPNVVGEAMSMSVPCVVTDVGDAAILIGQTGIVVEKENSELLADGLRRMIDLSIPARCARGAAAKQRVEAEFSMDRARARYENVYDTVVVDSGRAR